jgi:hypothetical protein
MGTELAREGRNDGRADPIPALGQGATRDLAFTGTAATDQAVGAQTTVVRLQATEDCRYLIGANPTATTASGGGTALSAGVAEYRRIAPGHRISVIAPSGGASGSLNIEECA